MYDSAQREYVVVIDRNLFLNRSRDWIVKKWKSERDEKKTKKKRIFIEIEFQIDAETENEEMKEKRWQIKGKDTVYRKTLILKSIKTLNNECI